MPELEPITREEKFLNGEVGMTPITREEKILAGEDIETITRREYFLKKYRGGGGGDVTVVPLSVTENGTYTAPSGKAYSPVSVNVPLPQNAYLLKSVTTPTPIASFNDGEDMVMPSLKVAIEPQQDLHGYDSPWVGGAGKNKLNPSIRKYGSPYAVWGGELSSNVPNSDLILDVGTYTFSMNESVAQINVRDNPDSAIARVYGTNVMTFTIDQRKAVKIAIELRSGQDISKLNFQLEKGTTATSFAPYSNICPISGWSSVNVGVASKNLSKSQTNNSVLCSAKKGVTYTVSFEGNVGANIKKNNNSGEVVIWGPQLPLTFTADEDFNIYLNAWNANISNIQVEVGNQATAYEPYNGTTYTIDLDGTRYGGELDVVNGVLTVDRAYMEYDGSSDENWWSSSGTNYYQYMIGVSGAKNSVYAFSNEFPKISLAERGIKSGFISYDADSTFRFSLNADMNITTTAEWMNWLLNHNLQICYELATPLTIQLSPTQVKSLLGQNNIWADTGDIKDAEYFSKEV